MTPLAKNITRYLNETLDEHVEVRPWQGGDRLPLFLRDRYAFFSGQILDRPVLFMLARSDEAETPATIRKHITHLRDKWDGPVVYVREELQSYNRKRLIEHHVPFIVPGKQMYLPPLGVDLRERFGATRQKVETLSPSTQAVLIYALLQTAEEEPLTAARLSPQLRYAPITLSRAFDELESADLARSDSVGRTRQLHLKGTKKAVWSRALAMLRSPVKQLHHVRGDVHELQGLTAGLSALAQRSMIVEPSNAVIAVSREDWTSAQQRGSIELVSMREADTVDVEVWAYPPQILSDNGAVDPLSLYLSLHDEADERIESALEHMLEALPW